MIDITDQTPEARALRATVPEILFTSDMRVLLGLTSESATLRAIKRANIPHQKIGRKVIVLRRDFMTYLRSRSTRD